VLPGLAAWLAVSAAFVAVEAARLADGLAMPVPLIVALVVARAVGATTWAQRRPALAALVIAVSSVAAAGVVAVVGADVPAPDVAAAAIAAALALLVAGGRLRRAALARLGLDPASPVHAVAVAAAVMVAALSVALVVALSDEPAATVPFNPGDSLAAVASDVALALAGVGFLLTRDLRAAVARLDLRPLTGRQVAWAALAAVAFLGVVGAADWAESRLLPDLHALESRFDYEFVGVPPLVGAVLVSLAAGVGEEILFRGALQPRLGIVATAALFGLLHVQYQVPGMLVIFGVGLALGALKARTSTTFTALVHVLYDLGTFLLDMTG